MNKKTGQSNRCLYWFVAAETVSQFGNGFNQLALIYLVLEVGNSPATMGAIVGISSVTQLIFRYLAGTLLDRGPQKLIIVVAEYASSIASFTFIVMKVLNLLNIYSLVACSILYSITAVFFDSSVKLILPNIVDKNDLLKANSLYTTFEQIARSVSPFLAGALIAISGSLPGMFIDGITSIFAATVTLILPIVYNNENRHKEDKDNKNVIISFYSKNNSLIWVLVGTLIINISLSSLDVVLPIFSNTDLHTSSFGVGIIVSSISIGMIVGSFLIGKFDKEKPKERYIVVRTGFAIIGLALILVGMIPSLLFSVVSFFVIGFTISSTGVITTTIWQQKIPKNIRGRVFSFNKIVNHVADPISIFFFSCLIGNISNKLIFLILGTISIVSSIILMKSKDAFYVDYNATKTVVNYK